MCLVDLAKSNLHMSREKFVSSKVNCFCSSNNAFVTFVTYITLIFISRLSAAAEVGFRFCVSISTRSIGRRLIICTFLLGAPANNLFLSIQSKAIFALGDGQPGILAMQSLLTHYHPKLHSMAKLPF